MWNKFLLWLHHVINPHCPQCEADKAEQDAKDDYCPKCEIYKSQIAQDRSHINQLIDSILKKPEPEIERPPVMTPDMLPRNKPWRVRQQELERADRERAQALKTAVTPDTLDDELKELHKVELGKENAS